MSDLKSILDDLRSWLLTIVGKSSVDGSAYWNVREDDIINDVDPSGIAHQILRVRRSTVMTRNDCPKTAHYHDVVLGKIEDMHTTMRLSLRVSREMSQNLRSLITMMGDMSYMTRFKNNPIRVCRVSNPYT